ncbi:MAG: type II secretion system protein N [Pseudomonadota bacterium]
MARKTATINNLSPKTLAAFCGLAFGIGAISFAPASLITPLLDAGGTQLSFKKVEGRLWQGTIVGARLPGQNLGDIEYRINPFSVLIGRPSGQFAVQGGVVTAISDFSVSAWSRELSLRNATVDYNLNSLTKYSIFGFPYQGRFRADIDKIVWGRDGCRDAQATLWTDILDASSREYVGDGMELNGVAACLKSDLVVAFDGRNREGETQIEITLKSSLSYQMAARLTPRRVQIAESLRQFGFEERNGTFTYDAIGELRGIQS